MSGEGSFPVVGRRFRACRQCGRERAGAEGGYEEIQAEQVIQGRDLFCFLLIHMVFSQGTTELWSRLGSFGVPGPSTMPGL
jgi:hypothetical protein